MIKNKIKKFMKRKKKDNLNEQLKSLKKIISEEIVKIITKEKRIGGSLAK